MHAHTFKKKLPSRGDCVRFLRAACVLLRAWRAARYVDARTRLGGAPFDVMYVTYVASGGRRGYQSRSTALQLVLRVPCVCGLGPS
eukprot:COSAG02_NODE_2279_length_9234_cov_37.573071_2_plen_86_part_00